MKALQLGPDASSQYGLFNEQRCQMCLRTDPLLKVMERLANPGIPTFFFFCTMWLVFFDLTPWGWHNLPFICASVMMEDYFETNCSLLVLWPDYVFRESALLLLIFPSLLPLLFWKTNNWYFNYYRGPPCVYCGGWYKPCGRHNIPRWYFQVFAGLAKNQKHKQQFHSNSDCFFRNQFVSLLFAFFLRYVTVEGLINPGLAPFSL